MSFNKVILIGHVGKDPEVIHLESGFDLAKFSLATNEKYKNKSGEKVEETEWHNIVVKGKLHEIVEKYVNKGDELLIEGKIKTRSYETADGEKKYMTEIVVDFNGNIRMMGKKKNSSNRGRSQDVDPGNGVIKPADFDNVSQPDPEEDDLPF